MLAAPINPSDLGTIIGNYPSISRTLNDWKIPGNEGCGIVESINCVTGDLRVGDRVIFLRRSLGTWASHVIIDDNLSGIYKISDENISNVCASTLSVNPATAYRLLKDYACKMTGSIIQNGANSAVGRYIIQMAQLLGIPSINIIRDSDHSQATKHELIQLFDRSDTVVITENETSSLEEILKIRGIEKPRVAFNCIGSASTMKTISSILSDGATIVTYGGMSGKPISVGAGQLIFRNFSFQGFWLTRWYEKSSENEKNLMISDIIHQFSSEKLKISPYKCFNFDTEWSNSLAHKSSKAILIFT